MTKLYTFTKIFHFHDRLTALQSGEPFAPLHIRLKPTNHCNHHCTYCCYRNPDLFLGELMDERDTIPPEKMRELIEDICALGVRAVTFSGGGEPLCYPTIVDAVRQLRAGDVKVAMLTNGSQLSGEIADLLAGEATWLRISLDAADAQSFARRRLVDEEEFNRVCAHMSAFAALPHKRCELGVNFILTHENFQDTYRFLSLMKELGADHVKISEAVVSVRGQENLDYVNPFYEAAAEQIARAQADLADEGFRIIDKVLNCRNVRSEQVNYYKDYNRCPLGHFLTVIGADQRLYVCQDKAYTGAGLLGSCKDRRLRDVWFDPQTQQRLRAIDPHIDCGHHCAQHEKNMIILDYLNADPEHLEFV